MVARVLILTVLLAAVGAFSRSLADDRVTAPGLPTLDTVDAVLPDWNSYDVSMSDNVIDVLGADTWIFRDYRRLDGARVVLFVGYFKDQKVGSQIHSPRNCLPGAGWTIQSVDPTTLQVAGSPLACNRMDLERNGQGQEVLYWFRTRSGVVVGEYALKWDLMMNSLRKRPTDAAFIRYMAVDKDVEAMHELMSVLNPQIDAALNKVGLP